MPNDKSAYLLLALMVVAFAAIGGLYAVHTPPWQAPDEPAHYNYIAQVARTGCCPVIAPGDWDAAYLETLKAAQFPAGADLSPIQYEDHQPPLYYLVGAFIYRLSGGALLALRLLSLAFGAGQPLAVYAIVVQLFPRPKTLALAAAAFTAFLPQHVAILASVNNDSLAELVLFALLAVAMAYLGRSSARQTRQPPAVLLGGLLGVAFLTKLTIYGPALLAVALALVLRWRSERRSLRWLMGQSAQAAVPALALGVLWWGRNIAIYGWPDILAQSAHAAVVIGQLRTSDLIATVGIGPYLGQLLATTYHSFWGQFGWMGVPMPPRIYSFIGLFLLGDLTGLALLLTVLRRRWTLRAPQWAGLGILGAAALATLAQYAYYNLTFVQLQGRYLYPALPLLGLAIAGGLHGWALILGHRPEGKRWERWLGWLPLAGLSWMPLLTIYALYRYVIPFLG